MIFAQERHHNFDIDKKMHMFEKFLLVSTLPAFSIRMTNSQRKTSDGEGLGIQENTYNKGNITTSK